MAPFQYLAEREGFEPSEPVKVRAISSRVLSSTQPPLRKLWLRLPLWKRAALPGRCRVLDSHACGALALRAVAACAATVASASRPRSRPLSHLSENRGSDYRSGSGRPCRAAVACLTRTPSGVLALRAVAACAATFASASRPRSRPLSHLSNNCGSDLPLWERAALRAAVADSGRCWRAGHCTCPGGRLRGGEFHSEFL